jgi:hypothetical protein
LPSSAIRAMLSAAAGFLFALRVFFIECSLLASCLPQGDQMIEFALFVLAHFKDEGVEPHINPADRSMLFRQVGTVVLVVGTGEELPRFFESDPALRVPP